MSSSKNRNFDISNIFEIYRKIPEEGHSEFLSFCNYYKKEILALDFDEYIEIKLAYIKALYHLEKAHLFHKLSNQALVEILNQKEFTEHYRRVYKQILVLRAEQFIEENKIIAAQDIYKNLVLLNIDDKFSRRKLFRLIYKQELYSYRIYLGISSLLLIASLVLIIANHFIIDLFFPDQGNLLSSIIPFSLLVPICIIVFSYSLAYLKSKRRINKFIERQEEKLI